MAAKSGVLKDMKKTELKTEADMEALEEYLDDTGNKLTPFGLHTFGVAPTAERRNATARAVVSLDTGASAVVLTAFDARQAGIALSNARLMERLAKPEERASTAQDYERLALRSSGAVARAKAFTQAQLWAHALPGSVEVLLVPYLLWVTFASALTLAVWRLNPGVLG